MAGDPTDRGKSARRRWIENELTEREAFVRRVVASLLHDPSQQDDAVQEVLLAALERPPDPRTMTPWLARVARNVSCKMLRSDRRRTRREQASAQPESSDVAPPSVVDRKRAVRRVAAALAAVKEPYRSALLDRYGEGWTPTQIAARDGVPLATVRSRLYRGLRELRAELVANGQKRRAWWSGWSLASLLRGSGVRRLAIASAPCVLALVPLTGIVRDRETTEQTLGAAEPPARELARFPAAGVPSDSERTTLPPESNAAPVEEASETLGGGLSWRVIDESTGHPLHESVTHWMSDARFARVLGAFHDVELTAGRYHACVTALGFEALYFEVEVHPNRNADLGTLPLRRGHGSVTGRVRAPGGNDGAEWTARLVGDGCSPCEQEPHIPQQFCPHCGYLEGSRTLTTREGEFEFDGLASGTYLLWIFDPRNGASMTQQWFELGRDQCRHFDVTAPPTAAVDLHLRVENHEPGPTDGLLLHADGERWETTIIASSRPSAAHPHGVVALQVLAGPQPDLSHRAEAGVPLLDDAWVTEEILGTRSAERRRDRARADGDSLQPNLGGQPMAAPPLVVESLAVNHLRLHGIAPGTWIFEIHCGSVQGTVEVAVDPGADTAAPAVLARR